MDFTQITDSVTPAQAVKGFSCDAALKATDFNAKNLEAMGFSFAADAFDDPQYRKIMESYAKDAGLSLGDGNIDALGQFFMLFNESTINVLYRGRTAVRSFGSKNMGDWTTEKVVFKTRELTGAVGLYDDWSRPTLSAYNYGWDERDTLRIEFGIEVTKLEEAVASKMRRNAYQDKKDAVILREQIWLNHFFWFGFNDGTKKLYGVLNEPNIASAARKTNMAIDFGSSTITVDQVISQLRAFKQTMINDLQGNGEIDSMPVKILMPLKYQTALTVANTYNGYTGYEWMSKNWGNAKIEFCPELDTADDGDPLVIVFAQSVPDVGMDTVNLTTTSKLRLVGAMPSLKGREEAYSSSVAGALCACPLGIRLWASVGASS